MCALVYVRASLCSRSLFVCVGVSVLIQLTKLYCKMFFLYLMTLGLLHSELGHEKANNTTNFQHTANCIPENGKVQNCMC